MNLIPYIFRHIQNVQGNTKNDKKQEMDTRKTMSCIFVVDTSESMNYPVNDPPINDLNRALRAFPEYIKNQKIININIDISLIQTHNNNAGIISQFVPISQWKQEPLRATGLSPIGRCLETAIQLAKQRMNEVDHMDKPSYPVWILLFTDGRSTDGVRQARELLKEQRLEEKKEFILWIVATGNADMNICRSLTDHIIIMNHRDYDSVFQWTTNCFRILSGNKIVSMKFLETQYDLRAEKIEKG